MCPQDVFNESSLSNFTLYGMYMFTEHLCEFFEYDAQNQAIILGTMTKP